jgi:tetratricopeptide (TPR) repeat protein
MKMLPFALVAPCALTVAAFSQSNDCDTLENCQAAIQANPQNSLARYRLGEIYFQSREWMDAANSFREALNGNRDPKWIEVWSDVNLGKIFDVTGQRDRALNEYRLAKRTKDNTRGGRGSQIH